MNSENPRILIIKLSAIGDVVHTLPLLEVIRREFPSSRIDWVIEEDASSIVDGHPDLNEVIVFPRKSWLRRFVKGGGCVAVMREVADFVRKFRKRNYDVVVDLQGLLKSGVLAFIARGKRKIALNGGREGSSLFINEQVAFPHPDIHALDRYLCVAQYLGATNQRWEGLIPIDEADRRYVDDLLDEHKIDTAPIAINPMAKWRTKLWGLSRFASLADIVSEELEKTVIFTGGISDRDAIESILSGMKSKTLNFAGLTNLKQLAYLYQKCAAVVSTDTGPMHVAAAMGTPVVALFGPTSPSRTGPYGAKHRVVRAGIHCSPCFKKSCDDMSCMKEITVQKVFESVKEVMSA